MRLIAEIEAEDGGLMCVAYDGRLLSIDGKGVDLAELREALDAVAPKVKQRPTVEAASPKAPQIAPTRDASGARIGPSPRYTMRAIKAEPSVDETEEEDAA